jgi:LysR family nitrogen assimilation transcriptional regulator
MDLRTLRYFQVVAQCGSYTRGSELLRISQPAVSRAVRTLEEELGRTLFERRGNGVVLTDAGRILLERSQTILRQVEQTASDVRSGESGLSGAITIALPPAAGHYIAPALAKRIAAEFPNVSLRFIGGYSGYIHEWLIRGQVDIACLHDPLPQRGFETTALVSEEVFLVGKRGSLRGSNGTVSADALLNVPLCLPGGQNLTRQLLNNWAGHNGIQFQPKVEIDDHTMTRALIQRGECFSLLTRGAFADDLARGDVEAFSISPSIFWTLMLVTCVRAPRSPLVERCSERLVETVTDLRESGVFAHRGNA